MTTKCKQAIEALCRDVRKWAPRSTFGKLYQATIEPIMCYSIESWYPSQVLLQNSTERVKKYAAKITLNNELPKNARNTELETTQPNGDEEESYHYVPLHQWPSYTAR
jgi:hypothetical protein